MSHSDIGEDSSQRNIFRISFCGVFPSLLPCGDQRVKYTRQYSTYEQADLIFEAEPSAFQLDRWEPQTNGWVVLAVRDRQ